MQELENIPILLGMKNQIAYGIDIYYLNQPDNRFNMVLIDFISIFQKLGQFILMHCTNWRICNLRAVCS